MPLVAAAPTASSVSLLFLTVPCSSSYSGAKHLTHRLFPLTLFQFSTVDDSSTPAPPWASVRTGHNWLAWAGRNAVTGPVFWALARGVTVALGQGRAQMNSVVSQLPLDLFQILSQFKSEFDSNTSGFGLNYEIGSNCI
jgi:hypothetical protein